MDGERASEKGAARRAALLATLDEVEVEVEKLVAGGEGLARYQGIPLFIPRSAPGDRLRVRIVERRPDYGRAEVVEILSPAPSRREPPCPFFERCGGCDLQHIDDRSQARFKAEAVLETLRRLGGVEVPEKLEVVTGERWGYRLRTQLHTRAGESGEPVAVGYFARGSHDLVAVDRCPILVPELERFLPQLPGILAAGAPPRLDLAVGGVGPGGEPGEVTASPKVEGLPVGEVELQAGGLTYGYDARAFFQAHRGLVGELVERAVGPWQGEVAFDLYAGVGLFALALAQRYGRVVAVEGDRVAARLARHNARRNRLTLEVEARAVETWIQQLPQGPQRVLVDPPRGGLAGPVRRILRLARAERLTYVSCHAATLARDLKGLGSAYRLESLTLLDLFPQTGHMEVVAQLTSEG